VLYDFRNESIVQHRAHNFRRHPQDRDFVMIARVDNERDFSVGSEKRDHSARDPLFGVLVTNRLNEAVANILRKPLFTRVDVTR